MLLVLCLAAEASADAPTVKVIPPGREALLTAMLGGTDVLPGGCSLDEARVDRTMVAATYRCEANHRAALELRHPSDATGAIATTHFAIVASTGATPALIDAVAARVRERESAFRWVSAEAPGLGVPSVAPTPSVAGQGLSPEEAEAFVRGGALYRAGRFAEALSTFTELARRNPHDGVLGMVVASLASGLPDRATVDRLGREADAHPTDSLAQFQAGVAAHYHGHQSARTHAAKLALYEQTIRYLARALPAYEFEPRVFVYLAVSHFRLGHQAEAEQLIARAVPIATNDPDVYYCRAEIYQRADVARAIGDIQTYLRMVEALRVQGVPLNESKHARVVAMLASLRAVQAGTAPPPRGDELFDPLNERVDSSARSGLAAATARPLFGTPKRFAMALGIVAVLVGVLWSAVRARQRRSQSRS